MENEERESADRVRLILMDMGEALITPWREWLAGAVAHFVNEGFTHEQAHAMAASEYSTLLGQRIECGATRPEDS